MSATSTMTGSDRKASAAKAAPAVIPKTPRFVHTLESLQQCQPRYSRSIGGWGLKSSQIQGSAIRRISHPELLEKAGQFKATLAPASGPPVIHVLSGLTEEDHAPLMTALRAQHWEVTFLQFPGVGELREAFGVQQPDVLLMHPSMKEGPINRLCRFVRSGDCPVSYILELVEGDTRGLSNLKDGRVKDLKPTEVVADIKRRLGV